ncbi:MAG TPA: FHA domain-containing protein, partial [Candidatus Binataceae bacterium]|nr:FHA domain-containing protein [Candidatus Binataceae bacterium]
MRGRVKQLRTACLLAVDPVEPASRELKLSKPESSVGSENSNDVVICHATVSRHHAEIRRRRGRWQVLDNQSTNGTFVGGRKAVTRTTLHNGEEVRFGGARFVFRLINTSDGLRPGFFTAHRRISILRAGLVLVLSSLVAGFAATQYFLFVSYRRQMTSARPAPTRQQEVPLALRKNVLTRSSPSPQPSRATASSQLWLERVNYWRRLAGLQTVSGAANLSAAAENHARYLVKHALEDKADELASGGAHREDPSDPWYTPYGFAAAQNGDVAPPCQGCPLMLPSQQVDNFLTVPFHRLPILDPQVQAIGYGSYTEGGLQAAVLYIPRSSIPAVAFKQPIEFPPNGSNVDLADYLPEWPDPLSSCANYQAPAGIPITLELGPEPSTAVTNYSIKSGNTTLESCIFNASSYRNPYG